MYMYVDILHPLLFQQVNFDSLVAESEAQRRRVEEREEKQRIMREQRLLTAKNALQGIYMHTCNLFSKNIVD